MKITPLLCSFALVTASAAFAQTDKATTIMAIGDSLTATQPGYRGPLFAKLKEEGFKVEFVGPKKAEPGKPDSTAHAGHGGFTIGPGPSKADEWANGKGNIHDNVDKWLKTQPDIVLLLIGTNDYFNIGKLQPDYKPDKDGPARLGGLLEKIHAVSPKSTILVSSIMPVGWSKDFARPFNEAIPSLIATRPYTTFVDLNKTTGFVPGDWSKDNLHPSNSGYLKMSTGWFEALKPILSAKRQGD